MAVPFPGMAIFLVLICFFFTIFGKNSDFLIFRNLFIVTISNTQQTLLKAVVIQAIIQIPTLNEKD